MLTTAASITLLDHHISAEKDLSDLLKTGKIKGKFDMSKSGAMLVWEWFNPDKPPPKLIEYIQDRDLWLYKLDGTLEINAALSSYPHDFKVWDKLIAGNKHVLEDLKREGEAIERKLQRDIKLLIESGVRRMIIGGYDVPVLNAPAAYVSDAGNIMSMNEPFAACYWDHPDGRSFSLRSSEQGIDVSEVAIKYGGGGHVKAAGFTMEIGWEGE
jgi:oligoribonuclease NrnB/cAMP/cGMP phosphodiesterase (DHH superfamily)